MTERRAEPDRRDEPRAPVPGRRSSDHGTRACYQQGCGCTPCKAAEALYRSSLRLRHLKGLQLFGGLVSAVEARRRVRQFKDEGYTRRQIAVLAGYKNGHLQFTHQHRIRLSTLLRLRKVARWAMLEGESSASDGATPTC